MIEEIHHWRERAEKICQSWDMGRAILLAEEIRGSTTAPLLGAAVSFLAQTESKSIDDQKLAVIRNAFHRLCRVLQEEQHRLSTK
jgi:hypothetical protein